MGDAGVPRPLQESVDASKVEYKQLGNSGLRVSLPILGAMSFGKLAISIEAIHILDGLVYFAIPMSKLRHQPVNRQWEKIMT